MKTHHWLWIAAGYVAVGVVLNGFSVAALTWPKTILNKAVGTAA